MSPFEIIVALSLMSYAVFVAFGRTARRAQARDCRADRRHRGRRVSWRRRRSGFLQARQRARSLVAFPLRLATRGARRPWTRAAAAAFREHRGIRRNAAV